MTDVSRPRTAQPEGETMADWWRCPNVPPCPHAGVLHDVHDFEDPLPRCCVEGCPCGSRTAFRQCIACGDDIWPGEPPGDRCAICQARPTRRSTEGDQQ